MKSSILRLGAAQGIFIVLAAFGSQAAFAWPTTAFAGTCGTPSYPTIQAAVTAVATGGTV
jgi:hypothetical protein